MRAFSGVVWLVPALAFSVGSTLSLGHQLDPVKPNDQSTTQRETPVASGDEPPPQLNLFGGTGINLANTDGRCRMHLWFRGQFRYFYPFDDAPTTPEGFEQPAVSSIVVRRARIKLKGNAYRTWLKYYFEYDFVINKLLDLRFTLSRYRWLQLRVGQWKVNYNRERADSSGRQEFVDNINRTTTDLRGTYVQVGLFPWSLTRRVPKPLELAFRYAWVDPDRSRHDNASREIMMAANWFFAGHDNKLTFDISRLAMEQPKGSRLVRNRFRAQWDISF